MKSKEGRLEFLDETVRTAAEVRAVLRRRARSPNPSEAVQARPLLIQIEILEEDLRVNRAFLDNSAALTPISEAAARELDELGAVMDKNTKDNAIARASIAVLAQTVTAATRIGQILDERPADQVRAATSGPLGT